MRRAYHEFTSCSEYQQKWVILLDSLGVDGSNLPIAVIIQHVAKMMLDKMIVEETSLKETDVVVEMSDDEDQTIWYTCGFVVRRLKKKLSSNEKYVEVLESMHDDEVDADNFLTYTREWTSLIDHGGIYKVSDEAFLLNGWKLH